MRVRDSYRLGVACAFGLVVMTGARAPVHAQGQTQAVAPQPVAAADTAVAQPAPIAIAIKGEGPAGVSYGAEISSVIAADLEQSGVFSTLDPASFAGIAADVNIIPDYSGWKAVKARYLGNGRALMTGDGRLRVDFRLWDIDSHAQVLGQSAAAVPENGRRIGHKIADTIYAKVTGEEGRFETRIAFVAESGTGAARVRRLAIMDQDGANMQYLTDASTAVATPRFSADGQEIAYVALKQDGARILVFNIETGRQESLGNIKGALSAPRFSPDGTQLAFSVSADGNSDIYVMNLRSRAMNRVTSGTAADTSPSFSPDGSHIVFASDRSGTPQIYVMLADGSDVRPLTTGGDTYASPAFSPKGDLIVFTKRSGMGRSGTGFVIGVMNADGSGERLLTPPGTDMTPCWAHSGRDILFVRETSAGLPTLWTIDTRRSRARAVLYSGAASDPDWSPRL